MATIFTMYAGLAISKAGGSHSIITNANRSILLEILNRNHSEGYTLLEGIGGFECYEEPTVIASFVAQTKEAADELGERVAAIAAEYKEQGDQQEVWITRREEELLIV
jgi:hypothetical protein